MIGFHDGGCVACPSYRENRRWVGRFLYTTVDLIVMISRAFFFGLFVITLRLNKRQFVVWRAASASTQQKPESAARITDESENYQPLRPIAGWKENKTLAGHYNNRLSLSL